MGCYGISVGDLFVQDRSGGFPRHQEDAVVEVGDGKNYELRIRNYELESAEADKSRQRRTSYELQISPT